MKTRGGSITWGQFGNIRESKIPKFSPPTAAFYPYKSRFLDLKISKFSPPTAAFYPYKSRFLDLKISKFSPPTAAFYPYKSRFLNPKCITTKLTPSAWPPTWPQVHDLEFDPKCMIFVWPQVHSLWNWWFFSPAAQNDSTRLSNLYSEPDLGFSTLAQSISKNLSRKQGGSITWVCADKGMKKSSSEKKYGRKKSSEKKNLLETTSNHLLFNAPGHIKNGSREPSELFVQNHMLSRGPGYFA